MSEELGELPVALYDFLYRDPDRISSYAAQIFSGLLTSFEDTDEDRTSADWDVRGNVGVASAKVHHVQAVKTALKRTHSPHDVIVTDVLPYLRENKRLSTDLHGAAHGGLISAQGTLVFFDRSLAEVSALMIDIQIQEEQRKPRAKQNHQSLAELKVALAVFSKLTMPSSFLLTTRDGLKLAGTIKEAGMQEPISTYYFKHGMGGLSDVYVIGIKEQASPAPDLPDTDLISLGRQSAQAMSELVFPPDAIRITPIALFRHLP